MVADIAAWAHQGAGKPAEGSELLAQSVNPQTPENSQSLSGTQHTPSTAAKHVRRLMSSMAEPASSSNAASDGKDMSDSVVNPHQAVKSRRSGDLDSADYQNRKLDTTPPMSEGGGRLGTNNEAPLKALDLRSQEARPTTSAFRPRLRSFMSKSVVAASAAESRDPCRTQEGHLPGMLHCHFHLLTHSKHVMTPLVQPHSNPITA